MKGIWLVDTVMHDTRFVISEGPADATDVGNDCLLRAEEIVAEDCHLGPKLRDLCLELWPLEDGTSNA